MDETDRPRVALVTGGGRGIGRAISRRLAADGFVVAVNFRRDEASATATVDEIRAAGGQAAAFQGSVAEDVEVDRMTTEVRRTFGHVDVLISNGGVSSRGLRVADTPDDELRHVWDTNALGPFRLCRALVPHMRELPRGDVVLISSVNATECPPNGSPYSMAKAALEALARTLAAEERGSGVRVNVVAPGLVATEMGDRLVRALSDGARGEAADLDAASPFGRVCRPDDVAAAVAFLVSDGGSYVTGHRLVVDGGGSHALLNPSQLKESHA